MEQRCDNNVIDKMGVNYLVVSHKCLCGHGEIMGLRQSKLFSLGLGVCMLTIAFHFDKIESDFAVN